MIVESPATVPELADSKLGLGAMVGFGAVGMDGDGVVVGDSVGVDVDWVVGLGETLGLGDGHVFVMVISLATVSSLP
jgi:hypothetical protein